MCLHFCIMLHTGSLTNCVPPTTLPHRHRSSSPLGTQGVMHPANEGQPPCTAASQRYGSHVLKTPSLPVWAALSGRWHGKIPCEVGLGLLSELSRLCTARITNASKLKPWQFPCSRTTLVVRGPLAQRQSGRFQHQEPSSGRRFDPCRGQGFLPPTRLLLCSCVLRSWQGVHFCTVWSSAWDKGGGCSVFLSCHAMGFPPWPLHLL